MRAVKPGEEVRAGRWWSEAPEHKELRIACTFRRTGHAPQLSTLPHPRTYYCQLLGFWRDSARRLLPFMPRPNGLPHVRSDLDGEIGAVGVRDYA